MESAKALGILLVLADGIDPSTGEVLPPDSLLQRPEVVRALGVACVALGKPAWHEKSISMAGQFWTTAEDRSLVSGFDKGLTVFALARQHHRTVGAIKARLSKFGRLVA